MFRVRMYVDGLTEKKQRKKLPKERADMYTISEKIMRAYSD